MFKVKSIYTACLLALGLIVVASCNKDNTTPDGPKVTAPSLTDVQISQTIDLEFQVDVPGGYASASATAVGGSVSVVSEPAADATSGKVVLSYVADANVGAGSVTLQVTDSNQKTDDATASINKTAEPTKPIVEVYASAEGTGTVTWTKDNIYVLRGFIFVNPGDVLTIEPGTVIKGQPGQGSGASALIVSKGAKLLAEGTASEPIIMTGLADDLKGSIPDDANQTWGGLILLGKATTNNNAEGGSKNIEGLPTTDDRTFYGGNDDNDNSGVVKYVSVRHAGSVIGANNEINGITLGGVGAGTVIDHVEIFNNFDDGIEFFGGNATVTNAIIVYTGDDGLDEDEGYHGTVQNAVIWKKAETNESSDPRGAELDGGVGANEAEMPFGIATMANITLFFEGSSALDPSATQTFYMRDGWAGRFFNSIFYGFEGPIDMERRTDKINSVDGKSASCYDMWLSVAEGGYGTLKIENNLLYTNGATTNDAAGFASVFVLSDETDAAKELEVEQYLMANNKIVDPGFGSGTEKFTPSTADATSNVKTGLSSFDARLVDKPYKGAVDPSGTPFYANWTKTWSVLNN
jgi:hypothetical protein